MEDGINMIKGSGEGIYNNTRFREEWNTNPCLLAALHLQSASLFGVQSSSWVRLGILTSNWTHVLAVLELSSRVPEPSEL